MIKTLEDIYVELHNIEARIYQLFKDSDETSSVHLTMLQQDVSSSLTILEDLLGKE